jgi:putative PIN family toxin of toxin-antitoxin system
VRIVLDTNVFVSGVFFSGPPYEILRAWSHGKVQIVMSEEILEEYRRVGEELSEQFPEVDLEPMVALLVTQGQICLPTELPGPVCDDPDDDKFLACAVAGKVKVIVSGDKHLLKVSGYRGIDVLRPRKFLEQYMT